MEKAVIFDCFGVLIGSSIEFLRAHCPAQYLDELNDLNHQLDYGYISGGDYVQEVARLLDWPVEEARAAIKKERVRNEPLIEFVKGLKKSGVKTALLSNVGSQTLEDLYAPGELEEMFDVQVLSYLENLAKPNPEIFTLAAQRIGAPADACIMVDDRAENCEGAEVAGLHAVQHVANELTVQRVRDFLGEKSA